MVYHLKRISVWPVVKLAFIISGVIGLCIGSLYGLALTFLGGLLRMTGGEDAPSLLGMITGVAGVVIAILVAMMCAVFGAIAAAVVVWLYNALAGLIGGVEFLLEPVMPPESPKPVMTESLPMADTVAPPTAAPEESN